MIKSNKTIKLDGGEEEKVVEVEEVEEEVEEVGEKKDESVRTDNTGAVGVWLMSFVYCVIISFILFVVLQLGGIGNIILKYFETNEPKAMGEEDAEGRHWKLWLFVSILCGILGGLVSVVVDMF